jgi:nicotinate-nucleotide pyrophosphorylase (carboxylating)
MLDSSEVVRLALAEDIGPGDITTQATVPADARCQAIIRAKDSGVLSGTSIARQVFERLDAALGHWEALSDGAHFETGDPVISFEGLAAAILTGERTALNFLQHLSGIATATAAYVEAVAGTGAVICETRKTTPLLRQLEKQAVLHGGGRNHRHALYDAMLIKENHIAAAGGIRQALEAAQGARSHMTRIEIEVTSLEQLREALQGQPDAVLLDNMDLDTLREAVAIAQGSGVILEASGNMTLDRVRPVAETGVSIISVGALTHSVQAVDLSLLITS